MKVLDYFRRSGRAPTSSPPDETKFLALTEASAAIVLIVEDDIIRFANKAARGLGGIRGADLVGSRFSDLAHGDSRETLRQRLTGTTPASLDTPRRFELKMNGAPGSEPWIDLTLSPIGHEGRIALLAMGFEITDRKLAEGAMRESERRLRDLIENVQLISVLLDREGEVTFANEYALELLGLTEENVVGHNWFERVLPLERSGSMRDAFRERIAKGTAPHEEYEILTARGEPRVVSWNSTVLHDPAGAVCGMASIGADVTERRRAEKRLLHDALHDSLTSLPNRALFMDRLRRAMARLKRRPTQLFAVLFLDLDRFKVVNDSLGHLAGDQFLVQIGRVLSATLRAEHTLARFGGDEFAILLDDLDHKEDASRVVDRIFVALQTPIKVSGQDIFGTVSIGVAYSGGQYESAEDILRDADTAMYQAKTTGKSRFQVFDESMHQRAVGLLKLEHSLRRAADRNEFVLHYQPIVALSDERTVGFEALLRWNHPERGIVGPYEFMHLVEETGLIFRLGEWTLGEACRWLTEGAPTLANHLTVNVNLSGRQFSQGDLIEQVETVLSATGLAADRLKLEITESVIMENPEMAVDLLKRLRALGTHLCIDDFGTGYSSLSYLLRFPADTLKIDRSFVGALGKSNRNEDIVGAIVSLARSLDMAVVAEGVETVEQRNMLGALGCQYGQGYLFSRPLDGDRARAFVQ
ncbi:MAG: EAL domain-containing protein [Vicinamibacteria bacterium]|nr:EAL domain-containing protein [Vicinamibacteria bacterium]